MMGLQPPRDVTWEEVVSIFCLQLSANRRQKMMCIICLYVYNTSTYHNYTKHAT